MMDSHKKELEEELRQFKEEQQKVRRVIGQIGGKRASKSNKTVTILLIIALGLLFVLDASRHFAGIPVPLPPLFSIELGILLVSIKIILMIHNQSRVEHFHFWMLHSIEFRIDQIAKQLKKIEKNSK